MSVHTHKALSYISYISSILYFLLVSLSTFILVLAAHNLPMNIEQEEISYFFFIHIPFAWISFFIFFLLFVLVGVYYFFTNSVLEEVLDRLNSLGFMFTLLTLFTGSLWAKQTWGTWFVLDSRMLLVLFLCSLYYLNWLTFRFSEFEIKEVRLYVVTFFGCFCIPLVKYSTLWWSTLHQPSGYVMGVSLPKYILFLLILIFIALIFYTLLIIMIRLETALLEIFYNEKMKYNFLSEEDLEAFIRDGWIY